MIILNSDNQQTEELSTCCPACGNHTIEKQELSAVDFDEHGWYHSQGFKCMNPGCKHSWNNKIIIMGGGVMQKYG